MSKRNSKTKAAWRGREYIKSMKSSVSVPTPEPIKGLLWDAIPAVDEHNDPVSLHNTLVLAAYIRGKESK